MPAETAFFFTKKAFFKRACADLDLRQGWEVCTDFAPHNSGNPRGIPSPWRKLEGRALEVFGCVYGFGKAQGCAEGPIAVHCEVWLGECLIC